MQCSNCNTANPEGLKFCEQCGAPFKRPCSNCGFGNSAGARYCGECGRPLGATDNLSAADAAVPKSNYHDGERRHLTVLFCDLVGSTAISAGLDPEQWRATLAAYHHIAADAVTRFGG